MQLELSIVLVVCFQIIILQGQCNSLQESKVKHEAAKASSKNRSGDGSNAVDHGTTYMHSTNSNQTHSNQSASDEIALDEFSKFRLEYNKYKILSHLSITQNVHEIKPRIDEDLRYKLLTSAARNTKGNSATNRRKRSLTCDQTKNEKNACCLDNFYVNFTHIGWDKWILYPPGYQANYCRGKCDLSHARYYHSTLLSKYSHIVSLCCSPRQMAPLSLLYVDEENKVHQKSIPDMVVESCDCA